MTKCAVVLVALNERVMLAVVAVNPQRSAVPPIQAEPSSNASALSTLRSARGRVHRIRCWSSTTANHSRRKPVAAARL